ncbi:PREDICTED: uncharacterized protein LOC106124917 isoform X2 [Papilio xuthus]|uniref:Uncharacterized protein LOC106124917 isoform X2 n=2 Tax=Papilio xuthus TaxID=66420 RepID=A0AAJ6ZQQ3_PAPXU|nr:PREDICTED: uncharacterized protein LOC106124917 isoform X2 [Papilio xuthus]
MDSKGMMAVVRGLPDSGLMVTLMDGGKQYTLMPKTGINSSPTYEVCNNCLSRQSQCGNSEVRPRQDSGAQAVDGRYASSYKIEYCNMRPTSPPVELTEFPPQRARLQPGRGNFEVGGIGSGGSTPRASGKRTYSSCRAVAAAANIPQSKSNAFASSLRRYPSVGPEPSSEVFERLISYTKPSDSSRLNNPNDCLTCYQVTPTTRYPRFKHYEHKTPRHYDASPTRYDGLLPHEYDHLCKYHEHINDMYYGNSRGIDSKSPYHRMNSNNMRMQDAASVVATLNESSYVDLPSSKLDSEENLAKGKSSNVTLEAIHIRPNSLRDNKSMQTFNSLIELRPKRKTKAHRKPKKAKITNPLPAKRKILTRKPKQDDCNTCEHKRLKTELLELIKELNNSEEDKMEDKLREVLCKILNCILKHRKQSNSKDSLIHDLIKQCDIENVASVGTESFDFKKETLEYVWEKYSNEAAKIQRAIKDDMLPILKYHLFKEHENEVVNFILSKIIKDIVGVVSKIEYKYLEESKNSLQQLRHLGKPKVIDNKKSQHMYQKAQEQSKKCRYPIAIRNLGKTKTVDNLNKNINNQSNESIDLELQSIVNIYQVLKKIHSSSEFQANYVTSMLLNRFCTTKAYDNELKNCYRKSRPCLSPAKCISDTYIMIHDSSRNKAILTKKKMDKMNLHGSTKLLTSIKNKQTMETSMEQRKKKNDIENVTNEERQQTICQAAIHENIPSPPLAIEAPNIDNDSTKEETSQNNGTIPQQIENKIRQWFMKFGIYTIQNTVCYDNILRNLTEDITTQLTLLNKQSSDATRESVADYLKCVICKHLFLPMTGRNFELAHKLSELTKDVLNIFNLNTNENCQTKIYHEQSPIAFTSHQKEYNIPKPPSLLPGSYYKADKSVMKDIYSRIMLCDENILKILPRDLLKQEAECYCGQKCRNGECQNRAKNLNKDNSKNKSDYKIILTTTNTNDSENAVNSANTSNDNAKDPNSSIQPNQNNVKDIPENATRQQLHEYCVETFRNYCKELPILATNPDLTELAREGVLHNILKLFYMLIEDSHVENDYTYFQFTFEDEIDGLLDILPQTEEMKNMRQRWKSKIVMEAVNILKYMHKTKDDTEFKQKLNQVSDRRKLMVEQKLDDEYSQQLSALRMAEKFIATTDYREQNPLKMKVYMQRLMNRSNQIYECVKIKEGKPFLELPIESINEIVFKELQNVPIPNNDIEKQEINLVEINNEIEAWFNELPVVPTEGININKRKILKQSLANKINGLDMNLSLDSPGADREMKQEISVFLSDKAVGLEKDQDLNINYMVEDLARRLKRRRERENSLDYDSFKKHVPFNSSIQKIENSVNGSSQVQEFDKVPYSSQNVRISKNNERVRFEDQIPHEDKIVKLQPLRRSIDKGVLGTSQTPGPSTDEAYLTLSARPRTSNSQEPSQRYPNISSQRRKIFAPEDLNEISKFFEENPNGINKSGRYRSPSVGQQRSDYYSMREHPNTNNFFYDPRSSKSQYGGPSISTAQMTPPYGKPVNYNSIRDERYDYDMDYERERDLSRLRCKCGEGSIRRRRRRSCHCEDFYPMPSCCFLHNDF